MNLFEHRAMGAADDNAWQPRLQVAAQMRREKLAGAMRAADFVSLLTNELDRARVSNAAGRTDELLRAACLGTNAVVAAALCECFAEGEVVAKVAGEQDVRVPVAPAGLTPPYWMDGLALAILARDAGACAVLNSDALLDIITQRAAQAQVLVGNEAFWLPYGRAWISLHRGDGAAREHADAALQLLDAPIGFIDPACANAVDRPVLKLIAHLAAGDTRNWNEAVQRALDAFDAYYRRPDNATLLPGYLPLGILALCALAHDRGVSTRVDSPYLPRVLIEGGFERCSARVSYEFAQRQARSADEIRGWLDLEGVPRGGRTHTLTERDGALFATYDLRGWPASPSARATFIVDPTGASLLDAGEWMLLADWHAARVEVTAHGSGEGTGRMHLEEAITALDAILAMIPRGSDRVPDSAFHSARGAQVRDREPGRFGVARLAVVRATYAGLLAGTGASPANAHEASLALSEIVCRQAQPIIKLIAIDTSMQFVRELKPRDADYAQVFSASVAPLARDAYEALWSEPMDMTFPTAAQSDVRCVAAPAGLLSEENDLSRRFPGGYHALARFLDPHKVWLAWKYVRPGESSGLAYDGLVWCEDHWAWFPKPYRVLGRLLS